MEMLSEEERYQTRVEMGIITADTLLTQMRELKDSEDHDVLERLMVEVEI